MKEQASKDGPVKQKEKVIPSRVERVNTLLNSPVAMLYCLFLKNSISIFDKFNTLLQYEKPMIHVLRREMLSLLTDLFTRFVKPDSITSVTDLLRVKYFERKHQKNRDELIIGADAREYLKTMKISVDEETAFFSSVRNYFIAACEYLIKKLPYTDTLLINAEVADISLRTKQKFSAVEFFMDKFTVLKDNYDKDKVEIQFSHYQIEKLSEEIIKEKRIDKSWVMISQNLLNLPMSYLQF